MDFVFYRISDGNHAGALALNSLWEDAPENPTDEELAAEGIKKINIPPDKAGQSIQKFNIIDGEPIAIYDPPPYWNELIGEIASHPLYQRANILRETDQAVNACMSRITSDVFALNRDTANLNWAFQRLRLALSAANAPITQGEQDDIDSIALTHGFPADVFKAPIDPP